MTWKSLQEHRTGRNFCVTDPNLLLLQAFTVHNPFEKLTNLQKYGQSWETFESLLYKKGVKSVLHFSNAFHPELVMSFSNMELRLVMPVGEKNYPYCIREGELGRQQNYEANSNPHSDKILSDLRTLTPMLISRSAQSNQSDNQELKSEFLTLFLPAF